MPALFPLPAAWPAAGLEPAPAAWSDPAPAAGLSAAGWTIMLAWLAFVFGLAGWCYWRVLTTPTQKDEA